MIKIKVHEARKELTDRPELDSLRTIQDPVRVTKVTTRVRDKDFNVLGREYPPAAMYEDQVFPTVVDFVEAVKDTFGKDAHSLTASTSRSFGRDTGIALRFTTPQKEGVKQIAIDMKLEYTTGDPHVDNVDMLDAIVYVFRDQS